jgi:putative tryptophan/tyrosine transport system substrate-binding protein
MRVSALVVVMAGVLASPLAADAQSARRMAHVGLLVPGSRASPEADAFLLGMRDLGYVLGQNLLVDYRWADGKGESLPGILGELVRLRVDVIVTGGTAAALAAKQARTTVPIVLGAMGDPVGSGVAASLARPGGNITGLSLATGEDFAGKWLELLREIVPAASRVALLWTPPGAQLGDVQRAARTLGLRLQSVEVHEPSQLDAAFAAMTAERADAVLVMPVPFTYTHRAQIVSLAARHRVPAMYGIRDFVDAGGLVSYAASLRDLWRRAASYVDRILKGARTGDLPIEQPTTFELVVNLKTAKALGVTIPQSVLLRADEVIE